MSRANATRRSTPVAVAVPPDSADAHVVQWQQGEVKSVSTDGRGFSYDHIPQTAYGRAAHHGETSADGGESKSGMSESIDSLFSALRSGVEAAGSVAQAAGSSMVDAVSELAKVAIPTATEDATENAEGMKDGNETDETTSGPWSAEAEPMANVFRPEKHNKMKKVLDLDTDFGDRRKRRAIIESDSSSEDTSAHETTSPDESSSDESMEDESMQQMREASASTPAMSLPSLPSLPKLPNPPPATASATSSSSSDESKSNDSASSPFLPSHIQQRLGQRHSVRPSPAASAALKAKRAAMLAQMEADLQRAAASSNSRDGEQDRKQTDAEKAAEVALQAAAAAEVAAQAEAAALAAQEEKGEVDDTASMRLDTPRSSIIETNRKRPRARRPRRVTGTHMLPYAATDAIHNVEEESRHKSDAADHLMAPVIRAELAERKQRWTDEELMSMVVDVDGNLRTAQGELVDPSTLPTEEDLHNESSTSLDVFTRRFLSSYVQAHAQKALDEEAEEIEAARRLKAREAERLQRRISGRKNKKAHFGDEERLREERELVEAELSQMRMRQPLPALPGDELGLLGLPALPKLPKTYYDLERTFHLPFAGSTIELSPLGSLYPLPEDPELEYVMEVSEEELVVRSPLKDPRAGRKWRSRSFSKGHRLPGPLGGDSNNMALIEEEDEEEEEKEDEFATLSEMHEELAFDLAAATSNDGADSSGRTSARASAREHGLSVDVTADPITTPRTGDIDHDSSSSSHIHTGMTQHGRLPTLADAVAEGRSLEEMVAEERARAEEEAELVRQMHQQIRQAEMEAAHRMEQETDEDEDEDEEGEEQNEAEEEEEIEMREPSTSQLDEAEHKRKPRKYTDDWDDSDEDEEEYDEKDEEVGEEDEVAEEQDEDATDTTAEQPETDSSTAATASAAAHDPATTVETEDVTLGASLSSDDAPSPTLIGVMGVDEDGMPLPDATLGRVRLTHPALAEEERDAMLEKFLREKEEAERKEHASIEAERERQRQRKATLKAETRKLMEEHRRQQAQDAERKTRLLKAAKLKSAYEAQKAAALAAGLPPPLTRGTAIRTLHTTQSKLAAVVQQDEELGVVEDEQLAQATARFEQAVQTLQQIESTKDARIEELLGAEEAAWDEDLAKLEQAAKTKHEEVVAARTKLQHAAKSRFKSTSSYANAVRKLEAEEEELLQQYETVFDQQEAAAEELRAQLEAEIAQQLAATQAEMTSAQKAYDELLASIEAQRDAREETMARYEATISTLQKQIETAIETPPPIDDGDEQPQRINTNIDDLDAPSMQRFYQGPQHNEPEDQEEQEEELVLEQEDEDDDEEEYQGVQQQPEPVHEEEDDHAADDPLPPYVPLTDTNSILQFLEHGAEFIMHVVSTRTGPAQLISKPVWLWAESGDKYDPQQQNVLALSDASFFCCDAESAKQVAAAGRMRKRDQRLSFNIVESVLPGKQSSVLSHPLCAHLPEARCLAFGGKRAMVSLEARNERSAREWADCIHTLLQKVRQAVAEAEAEKQEQQRREAEERAKMEEEAAAAERARAESEAAAAAKKRSEAEAALATAREEAEAEERRIAERKAAQAAKAAATAQKNPAAHSRSPSSSSSTSVPASPLPSAPSSFTPSFRCNLPPLIDVAHRFKPSKPITDSLTLLAYGAICRVFDVHQLSGGQVQLHAIRDQVVFVDFSGQPEARMSARGVSPALSPRNAASPVMQACLYLCQPGKRNKLPDQSYFLTDVISVREGWRGHEELRRQARSALSSSSLFAQRLPASQALSITFATSATDPSAHRTLFLQLPRREVREMFLAGMQDIFERQWAKIKADGSAAHVTPVTIEEQSEPDDEDASESAALPPLVSPRRTARDPNDGSLTNRQGSSAAASSPRAAAAVPTSPRKSTLNHDLLSLLFDVLAAGDEFDLIWSNGQMQRVFVWAEFPDSTPAQNEEEDDVIHSGKDAMLYWCDGIGARGGGSVDDKGVARFISAGQCIPFYALDTAVTGKKAATFQLPICDHLDEQLCFTIGTSGAASSSSSSTSGSMSQRSSIPILLDLVADEESVQQLWLGAIKHMIQHHAEITA